MEDKKEIIKEFTRVLKMTRGGSKVADMILTEDETKVVILFRSGATRDVHVECDSGCAMLKDILKVF